MITLVSGNWPLTVPTLVGVTVIYSLMGFPLRAVPAPRLSVQQRPWQNTHVYSTTHITSFRGQPDTLKYGMCISKRRPSSLKARDLLTAQWIFPCSFPHSWCNPSQARQAERSTETPSGSLGKAEPRNLALCSIPRVTVKAAWPIFSTQQQTGRKSENGIKQVTRDVWQWTTTTLKHCLLWKIKPLPYFLILEQTGAVFRQIHDLVSLWH